MAIDDKNKALLLLLGENSRQSISQLARKLALSRSTVKDRIARLEAQGVIRGYTLRLYETYELSQIQAHVMIGLNLKMSAHITHSISNMATVKSLHTVSGTYGMFATISAESTQALDQTLDQINAIDGVEETVSSIILSTKFER